jgi:uncharacterized membrane protein
MTLRARSFVGGMAVGAGAMYTAHRRQTSRRDSTSVDRLPARRYGARAGDIAGLGAATLDVGMSQERSLMRRLRLVGGALVLYSAVPGARWRRAARSLGMGLVVRGGWPAPARAVAVLAARIAPSDRREIVDIQKTFYIEAPVEQVYAFWSDYENFPLFMSNVREVEDLGEGRSRWHVRGPAGMPVRWTARVTEQRENDVIGWRTEPGAMLDNAGIIRFHADGAGTRLDLRLCYRPPSGKAGQAVIDLFGADPRAKLNEDLSRLKTLLEATARSASHGKESRS